MSAPHDGSPAPSPSRGERYRSFIEPLAIAITALLLMLVFAHRGSAVVEGDTWGIDISAPHQARALRGGHPWVAGVMRDLSGLAARRRPRCCRTLFVTRGPGFGG